MKKTILFSFIFLLLFNKLSALTYTVNSTNDASTGSGTTGTLRWCITQANLTPAADIINFSIAGTFTVASNYPVITQPLTINGYTAPGSVQGQLGTGTRVLKIILNGPGNNAVYGFQITTSNCEISGLVIQDFYQGISISGGSNNWIWGCYIGTSSDGLSISSTTSCYDDGIALTNNANTNIIGTNGNGTNDANEGNLISGNGDGAQFLGEGVSINQGGTVAKNCTGNRISGNYLGTNETGTSALYSGSGTSNGQRGSGIQIEYSTANIIGTNGDGTSDALERNIISGNSDCGIVFIGSTGNKIKGNYIGTTKTGLVGLPNYANGGANITAVQISIKTASNNNFIGTDGDGTNDNIEGNVIGAATITAGSANSYNYGIIIQASTGNTIAGNNIGIGSDGLTALNFVTSPGSFTLNYIDKCIYISTGSTSTVIGTDGDGVSDAYERNYLGNSGMAIAIDNSNSCIVAGNYVGLGTNLTTSESLSSAGLYILNSTSCRVGSSALNILEKNYFCNAASSSDGYGIEVSGAGTANNDLINIRYNTVGIRPDNQPAANAINGIYIDSASNADTIQYNTVSQNGTILADGTFSGVRIETNNNVINNNTIFKNVGRGLDVLVISTPTATNNKISQNSIYNNGSSTDATAKYRVGIDLGWDGTTANDFKDPDTGPNDNTNFPIITGAVPGGSSCSEQIKGTFNGLPNTQYYVEVFSSDVCNGDTAGTNNYLTAGYNYGEGKNYVGTTSVFTTDVSGNATWSLTVTFSSIVGQYITATATQNSGAGINSTSEYSQCFDITYDCGDAPDIYHTLISNCGAVHLNVSNTLKIGATVVGNTDGLPSVNANLDTDEDGITTLPALTVKSTSYTLSNIPVTNTTGSAATLYAWIDFNTNGSFESSEFTSTTVASGATTATLTWNLSSFTCGSTLVSGNSYMRLRLTTSTLTDNVATTSVDERSYGEATDGEVEDYRLYIAGYDYGDLSSSYPVATALNLEDTAKAKVWAGVTKPSSECTQKYSADAYGDGAEEDGLTTSIGSAGSSYTWVIKLNSNTANKTVYYGLWLDWDGNANFTSALDAFYSGSAVVNGVTSKSVSVYAPYGMSGNTSFRLIASDAPLTSGMYNTTIANGEIEDYTLLRILTVPGNILMGNKQFSTNILKWKNTGNLSISNYTIEKSNDNISWSSIGSVVPMLSDNSSTQYSYSDVNPYAGKDFYRLKLNFPDNSYQYSNIILLSDNNDQSTVLIYPNPANNVIHLQTANSNFYKYQIHDLTGRVELSQSINSYNTDIDISNLSVGTHIIKLISKNGLEQVQKFVKTK